MAEERAKPVALQFSSPRYPEASRDLRSPDGIRRLVGVLREEGAAAFYRGSQPFVVRAMVRTSPPLAVGRLQTGGSRGAPGGGLI